jgi:hypothetical protein
VSDIELTDELKQMNRYYRLLWALVAESMGVLNSEGLSPEERLGRLREKLEFVRRYLRVMPTSVKAELNADPRVQATIAEIHRQMNDPQAADT